MFIAYNETLILMFISKQGNECNVMNVGFCTLS